MANPFSYDPRAAVPPRQPEDGAPTHEALSTHTEKKLSRSERHPHGFFGRPITHPGQPGRSNRRRYDIGGVLKKT